MLEYVKMNGFKIYVKMNVCEDEWFQNLCAKLGTEISLAEAMYAAFEKYESRMGNIKKDVRKIQ